MATAPRSSFVRATTHGIVSLVPGFLAGVVLFRLLGASIGDAVFSAAALATLVAVSRLLFVGETAGRRL